jgi:type IV fimbrial biogenesis protein FimT
MSDERGISLIEVLMALAITALLASAAVPLCRTLLMDARMASAVNALAHAIHVARAQAHAELADAVVCRSADSRQCAPAGDWSSGWIMFVNHDADDPPRVDDGEPLMAAQQGPLALSIASNRAAFVLRPFFLRSTNGTAVFCDARGSASARAVIISYTGRPRLTRLSSSGRPLTCPA